MKINKKQQRLFEEFLPQLQRFTTPYYLWVGFLSILIAFGMYALYIQETEGHIVTGMRDNVVWGIYIANFIFFIGISYAGAIISGIMHLLHVEWRIPLMRIAELITVIAVIIGPLYILLCMGRLDRLHHLIIYPRLQSPITWDVVAIFTYLVGSILFLHMASVRDYAIMRDQPDMKIGKWRKKLYKILALNYQNSPKQAKSLATSLNIMALIIIPIAIIVHSVLSWIFGMTLRPGWHSTIFGPYFVLAAIYSGTGVLIVAMYVFRRIYHLEEHITKKHFVYMGYIMAALAFGYGYFTFSEYLTDWYSSKTWDAELIEKLFNYSEYGGWFLFANGAGILLPLIVIGIPKLRSIKSITLVSFIMVIALWVKRYLIIVPTLENTLIPMQDIRPEYVKYSITWVEWALTIAGVALFLLMFTLASKFIPVIPVYETEEDK